jgi:hypothetical protein
LERAKSDLLKKIKNPSQKQIFTVKTDKKDLEIDYKRATDTLNINCQKGADHKVTPIYTSTKFTGV